MKFYYNNELIRTSKNHKYTNAVVEESNGKVYERGCRTSVEACQQIINSEVSYYANRIENLKAMIKALEAGKTGYNAKEGRKTVYIKFDNPKYFNIEHATEMIEEFNEAIESIKKNWKIVELEER